VQKKDPLSATRLQIEESLTHQMPAQIRSTEDIFTASAGPWERAWGRRTGKERERRRRRRRRREE
jgi:hypothetical protein